ncbi:MAG: hypothetical protein JXL80_01630 [Planctomycetes bacterium]|nr:hypothetical protein [Planctomycetota bacterium]
MTVTRWIIFGLLSLFWLGAVAANISVIASWLVHKRQGSQVLIFGTLAGVAAVFVMPLGIFSGRLVFMPIAALPDSFYIAWLIWWLVRRLFGVTKRADRVGEPDKEQQ